MTNLIAKMNRIFEGVLECRIEFQEFGSLAQDQWSPSDLELLNTNSADMPLYIEGFRSGTFGFPIHTEGRCTGLAVVKGFKGQEPSKLLLLAELFTLLFESNVQMNSHNDQLKTIEERLRLLEEHTNVIPLRPARGGRSLQVIETAPIEQPAPSPLAEKALLIETHPGFPLQRIVIEIYQSSQRWAFVCSDDLPAEIFNSKETLQQLGSVMLFIPNLAHLTTNQQLKLAEYLATEPSTDMPLVIAGVDESVPELETTKRVLGHLLELFRIVTLRPVTLENSEISSGVISACLRELLEQVRQTHAIGNHLVPFHIQYFDPNQPTLH